MRTVSLRRRLFLLVAAAILPLAAMSAIALLALVNQQRAQAERGALEITRALATAVDGELRLAASQLELLASAPALDTGEIGEFHELALRAIVSHPLWLALNIADPSARQLANTHYPLGAPLPELIDKEGFAATVRELRPTVGNLARGPRGMLAFTVRVPVLREGRLRYVVSVVVKPDAILEVVQRQRVPQDWLVSVFDARSQRVARSRQHLENLGGAPSESLKALMARAGDEGTGVAHALEGERIFTAFTRLPSGWSVAIGIPAALVETGAWRSAFVFGGGLLLSAGLGLLAALLLARRIARPIGALRTAARALGEGRTPQPPDSEIREIREAADALRVASAERARGEAEREQLLAREQEARAAAEAANRAKDEFLAMLGHELRNPLGAISNAVRLLEHPRADAAASGHAREIIGRQVDHLARMTDDLLDAGRAITGKIALHRKPLDLAAAAQAALATLKPRMEHHRIVQDLRSTWVDADPTRMEQVISNLVGNALKYTPAGGTVRVSVAREGAEAVLRVADDGAGMPEELTRKVFEPFVQGSRQLDRAHGGMGIGLTLVRRLAELHGGSAEASSPGPGAGSEFTVRLPCIAAPEAQPAAAPAASHARPRDILIVEDNEDVRESLRRLLELSGHRVRVENDGEAGLAAARASVPQVALLDVGLPRMDGYELARRLRALGNGGQPRPLLVALTGYGLPEDRERAFEAGFDAHLVKPVDEAHLAALLARDAVS